MMDEEDGMYYGMKSEYADGTTCPAEESCHERIINDILTNDNAVYGYADKYGDVFAGEGKTNGYECDEYKVVEIGSSCCGFAPGQYGGYQCQPRTREAPQQEYEYYMVTQQQPPTPTPPPPLPWNEGIPMPLTALQDESAMAPSSSTGISRGHFKTLLKVFRYRNRPVI